MKLTAIICILLYVATWGYSATVKKRLTVHQAYQRNYTDQSNWLHGVKPCYRIKLYRIVMAIRVAENGPAGKEWGIMDPRANTYELQMAWASATVIKNYCRWLKAGAPDNFIIYLGKRYCPPDAHPLNRNWVRNVSAALRRNQ